MCMVLFLDCKRKEERPYSVLLVPLAWGTMRSLPFCRVAAPAPEHLQSWCSPDSCPPPQLTRGLVGCGRRAAQDPQTALTLGPGNRHFLSHCSGSWLTTGRDILWLPPPSDWLFYLMCQRSCLLPSLENVFSITKQIPCYCCQVMLSCGQIYFTT